MIPTVAIGGAVALSVVLAGGIGWLALRRRDRRIESPEVAAAAAETTLADFSAVGAIVGADGTGAIAVGADGRVVAMKRIGKAIAVHPVAWTTLLSTQAGIVIDTGDRRFGRVVLSGVDALDMRRLAPLPRGTATR
ncbi:hypothetical protein ASE75_09670 [Sphingomonas sp. Leaf17]|uniref:hypothetical protein n=1 Tax=Sphingomonas sp. Leaf17 TaxID=1735683 RepID=UPI0006F82250|nr:hypothetical protein [Sphingomonas sp. Leaf17]KQM64251.1 hypothetical protein ASE75_09670 [Sphingomonas sp. Leaf17]